MDQVYQPTEVVQILPQPHISAAQFAEYLRIEFDSQEKAELDSFLGAAFGFLEKAVGYDIRKKTRILRLPDNGFRRSSFQDDTTHVAVLFDGPVQSLTTVEYMKDDGFTAPLPVEDYSLHKHLTPTQLHIRNYPTNIRGEETFPWTITYETGVDSIDEQTRQGILMIAADFYENRTAETNLNIKTLPAFDRLVNHLKEYVF